MATRCFLTRCHEVLQYVQQKQSELTIHAQELINNPDNIRMSLPFLLCELDKQKEIRTLWPYLLMIPESNEAAYFKKLYNCNRLSDLGTLIQDQINAMVRIIDFIETKFQGQHAPGSFWITVREDLSSKLQREAQKVLKSQG